MQSKTNRVGARASALALVVAAIGVIGSTGMAGALPAGPQSITVNDEAEYRAALATLSAVPAPVTLSAVPVPEVALQENTIVLAADITLTQQGQDPTYEGQVDLRIDGQGHVIDAADKSRVLASRFGGVRVTLDGVIAKNGKGDGFGGAVSSGGYLTLVDSTIQDSEATVAGGGVYAANDTVMESSNITGNSVPHGDDDYGSGGGVYVGSLQATAITVAGNAADLGGGIHARGALSLLASTVSGNTATGGRGYGGAMQGGDITIDNSTVTGNSGEQVGGIVAQTSLTATLSTIAGNTTTTGPANVQAADGVLWSAFATVIADPIGGANCLIAGPRESAFSYATDTSCVLMARSDVQNGADPELGELADNGGPTDTLLPGLASPLLDRLPNSICVDGGYMMDQRGEPRPEVADTGCDVGAVEGSGAEDPPVLCLGQEVTVDLAAEQSPTVEDDVIVGTPDSDVIDGLGGDDVICARGGDDQVTGGAGADTIVAGPGADVLGGGPGADALRGYVGPDVLNGANGNDRLEAGAGNDRVSGGAGADSLFGGFHRDRCDGGAGTDTRETCEVSVGFP
jgi:Ca2+-binding RTX toxin-like protein